MIHMFRGETKEEKRQEARLRDYFTLLLIYYILILLKETPRHKREKYDGFKKSSNVL